MMYLSRVRLRTVQSLRYPALFIVKRTFFPDGNDVGIYILLLEHNENTLFEVCLTVTAPHANICSERYAE